MQCKGEWLDEGTEGQTVTEPPPRDGYSTTQQSGTPIRVGEWGSGASGLGTEKCTLRTARGQGGDRARDLRQMAWDLRRVFFRESTNRFSYYI